MTIVLSVATAAEGFTSIAGIAQGIAIHAVLAVGGVQLVGLAKRMRNKRAEAAVEAQAG